MNEHLLQEARIIGVEALSTVTEQYGSGLPNSEVIPSIADMPYHNQQHSAHVQADARVIADSLNLNHLHRALVGIAALSHDIVQKKPRGVMEAESAAWLGSRMCESGFTKPHIAIARLAILGTEPVISSKGVMVGQLASSQEYPSKEAMHVALSVASADLARLFSPDGPLISRDYFKETHGYTSADEPDLEQLPAYQQVQLELLNGYRFPHPKGERVFGELRGAVIKHQVQVTNMLKAGVIENWQELIDQDIAFQRRMTPVK